MTNNRRKKKSKRNQLLTRQTSSQQMTSASEKALAHSMSNEVRIFKWLLFAFPFLFGLFFEVTAILAGIVLAIFLLYLIKKNGRIRIALNLNSVLLIFVFLSYLLVLPWSVDWGIGLIGFMKFSTVILFILVLMQFNRTEVVDCFKVIPWSGCAMVILTSMTYFIPDLAGYFIDAGRLGGFFQYANTFALFLLLGIIVLAESNRITAIEISKMAVLTGGMLLTGSRISLLMLLGMLIYLAITSPGLRKTVIITGVAVVAIVAGLFLLSGSLSAATRITTVFSDSSTLMGRLLYIRDAWFMLLAHPFGTGYMGYYYLQPQFQTGVYTTRFVHQEFLQLGLDAGIPAMLAFLVVCLRSLFSKRLSKMEKLMLAVILLHACLDFDFQYLIILYILMMTLDFGESRAYPAASVMMTARVFLIVLGLTYVYFFTALLTERLGYQQIALKMLPFNTEIKIYALSQAQTAPAFEYWSDQILAQNKTIALAYEGRAAVAAGQNDYDAMAENMDKMLLNEPYHLEKYQEYLEALETAMNACNDQGDTAKVKKFAAIALGIPERLDAVKNRSSKLAYLIDDKPNLDLTDRERIYLTELKKVMDQMPPQWGQ